jgi:hypothetical protein
LLFYLSGYNIKEIAAITETSEDAVKKNSRLIATTALALLMSFGIMSIISNVQDILVLRHKSIHINDYGN